MIRSVAPVLLLAAGLFAPGNPGWGQEKKEPAAKATAAPVVKLAAQSAKKPPSSLAYRLLPDPLDQVEGNAAVLWNRSMNVARSVRPTEGEKEWGWSRPEKTPLDKLPRKEVQALLDRNAAVFRLAGQAALRTRCDWEFPAPTLQTLNDLPLQDIAGLRQVAHLLNLRCRLALNEGNFDLALESMQAGFTLARHLGRSNLLIQDLVAAAISHVMLGGIEEWLQVAGSPNLYWALTALPRPLIDVRHSIRTELNTIYRSFPALRDLKKTTLSADEANRLVEKVFDAFGKFGGMEPPQWVKKRATTALTEKYYPPAKKGLLAAGRSKKEVEAMPALQVVAVHYLEQYDQARDEILQWLAVPAWQGRKPLLKAEADIRGKTREDGHFLIDMLLPAIVKVHGAQLRLERTIAGLRGAEVLRMYQATAKKAPAKWEAAAGEALDPTDPYTGKGLGAWYRLDGERGVLDVPAPPGGPAGLGRRYETAGKGDRGK